MTQAPPEFDRHAEGYEEAIRRSLPQFQVEDGYFTEYKIELLGRHFVGKPRRVLDFGCGIGKCLPLLEARFAGAEVWGFDVSPVSLEMASKAAPNARLSSDLAALPSASFDIILAANVFHHIPPAERAQAMARCASLLCTQSGRMFLFEHNPYNPATRWVFERCLFDQDAQMLSMRESLGHCAEAGMRALRKDYTLFFPRQLSAFRGLEPLLRWLPLGAQYCLEMARALPASVRAD